MATLPRYSSSLSINSVPLYSPEPSAGEQRLDHTALRGAARRPAPTGVLTRGNARVSVILTNQHDGAAVPTYGRNDSVKGLLHLKDAKDVTLVSVKLDGIIDLTVAEGSSSYTPLVTETKHVWQAERSAPSSSNAAPIEPCPDMIEFECTIPPTFRIGERTRQLPPSFAFSSTGIPGLFAKCKYVLTVEISKKSFWKRNTTSILHTVHILSAYTPTQTHPSQ
ncbi:hypothetical protein HWV62_169 [Athelia sp. TMB]|nr:hypothetical protein HWV62_169 [Athelia sp. TMB]